MKLVRPENIEKIRIEKVLHEGKHLDVTGITVQWLSKYGKDKDGAPAYGLRLFTAEPGGEIPAHYHYYQQTMYFLEGSFECFCMDNETGRVTETFTANPGDSVYVPSMEPHGMRNLSRTETATFLCCICNVYDEESA